MNGLRAVTVSLVLATSALALSCGTSEPPVKPFPSDGPMPEFQLEDVNETSPRFSELVDPRDYTGQVSAWYFGHAT